MMLSNNKCTSIQDVLARKELTLVSAKDINTTSPAFRKAAMEIQKAYRRPKEKMLIDRLMNKLRSDVVSWGDYVLYIPELSEVFGALVNAGVLKKLDAYPEGYELCRNNKGVISFINKGYLQIGCLDEVIFNTERWIDEAYYDVLLKNTYNDKTYHVDAVYRIANCVYFIISFLGEIREDVNDTRLIERLNNTLLNPIDRLKSSCTVVVKPGADTQAISKFICSFTTHLKEDPTIITCDKLGQLTNRSWRS